MKRLAVILYFLIIFIGLHAQKLYDNMTLSEKKLYNEHIIEGQPDVAKNPVFVRQGYVLMYNEKYRIPDWVAYHVIPDYLNTPKREKKYKKFRTDPYMTNPVEDKDYVGSEYARGHMAPYFAMGGDRDGNGVYSDLFDNSADPYDDSTIFQANFLSNISPQDQDALNGAGGPWYALETVIRNKLVGKEQMELHVVVGSIINDPENYKTMEGQYGDVGIAVPDEFFQVLIYKNEHGKYVTAGFLFPHVKKRADLPYENLIEYIVPVDSIEKITGLDFLNLKSKTDQNETESVDNKEYWKSLGVN